MNFYRLCKTTARDVALTVVWSAALGFASLLALPTAAMAGSYEDFFSAIKTDDASAIDKLLRRGFDPNTPDAQGVAGLLLAVREPSPKVIKVLLKSPKINAEVRNAKDESALMFAAINGQLDIATALIEGGADVNKPGWAPLHYAATKGHVAMIELLLENDAYIDAESPNQSTPLMMAAMYGTAESVKVLLEAGADPSIKNEQGLTAIDFANRVSRPGNAELIAAAIRAKAPKGRW
jgi:ankyrin repeat protein